MEKTGIEGGFDFMMDYGIDARSGDDAPHVLPIADAIHLLGLELKPDRATVTVLVIDHMERTAIEK